LNSLGYVDVNYSGSIGGNSAYVFFNAALSVPAASGQTWTSAAYMKLISGSFSGLNVSRIAIKGDTSTVEVEQGSASITSMTTAALAGQRYSVTYTMANASTTYAQPIVQFQGLSGQSFNFTLRIGMPQLELGAFPTSVIPTYSAAVTRANDVFRMPTSAAGANGAWYTDGVGTFSGVVMIPYELGSGTADVAARLADINDGSSANSIALQLSSANSWKGVAAMVVSSSLTYSRLSASGFTNNSIVKGAISYDGTNVYSAYNGISTGTATVACPTGLTELQLGNAQLSSGVYYLNGWLMRFTYFPTAQPSASLHDFTQ
jgi:hypothetical protein